MQTRSKSSASRDLVPAGPSREDQLQIVDPTSFRGKLRPRSPAASSKGRVDKDHDILENASKSFRLPRGWVVEGIPRKNSSQIDKCYVERETGKRFRSLVSVERYLKEPENHTNQQILLLGNHHRGGVSKDFHLPHGWIVEGKSRINSGQVDKSYIEPGTGNKFRSLAAVERYLKSTGTSTGDLASMVQSERLSLLARRNYIEFQTEVIDQPPPEKVKWVFTGPGGNMFTANMNGSDVSSSVKQTWSEAFVSLIQDRS